MAKYLVAFLILAAGGVTLLVLGADRVDEPSYEVELIHAGIHTQTLHLTEPASYALASLSWSSSENVKGFIVEKRVGEDFYILDTLSPQDPEMIFSDPDTLSSEKEVIYRLLALDKGKVYPVGVYSLVPIPRIDFTIPDTVIPENGQATLVWKPLTDIGEYEVEVMRVGTLAPIPMGETVAKGVVEPEENTVSWKFSSEDFEEETNLILKVTGQIKKDLQVFEITGYRLFILGTEPEEES